MSTAQPMHPVEHQPKPESLQSAQQEGPFKMSGKALALWGFISMVVGVASDLSKPMGDFTLGIFGFFAVITVLAGGAAMVQRLRRIAVPTLAFAGIGAIVFCGIAILQRYTPSEERGVIASHVAPLAALQNAILPVSPSMKALLRLSDALRSNDPSERMAAVQTALDTDDDARRRLFLDRILRVGDPLLNQIAILKGLKMRERTKLSLLPRAADPDEPLATLFIGSTLSLDNVNEATGALNGHLYTAGEPSYSGGRRLEGTVSRGGIVLSSQVKLRKSDHDTVPISFELSVNAAHMLAGTARTATGQSTQVEIPLF